jgi:hypothetical protein
MIGRLPDPAAYKAYPLTRHMEVKSGPSPLGRVLRAAFRDDDRDDAAREEFEALLEKLGSA